MFHRRQVHPSTTLIQWRINRVRTLLRWSLDCVVLCLPEFKTDSAYGVHRSLLTLIWMAENVRAACRGADCDIAGGWENFANNIGTDLAPLLTLFGEQVTKQFMSESLSINDSVLFALAPLGIITAIVAAIRVSGSPNMKALVGRAKESRGEVEADLMSSTSSDVCELWSGEGVVRVLGRPVLLQLIHVDPSSFNGAVPDNLKQHEEFAGLYTFYDAVLKELYYTKPNNGVHSSAEDPQHRHNPPNLSLNVSIKPIKRWISILCIFTGFVLQTSVVVFAALTQYQLKLPKDDEPPLSYGFPLLVFGTISLAVGMFLCAQVVETSTEEHVWLPRGDVARHATIIWIQQGDQTVGDQRFESFARSTTHNEVITSWKSKTLKRSLVTISVSAALIGFITQFVAFRAMHATVTVAQLGAVLIMTAIRSLAHIEREDKNDIKEPAEVEGHELDWLATSIHQCQSWEVVSVPKAPGDGMADPAPSSPLSWATARKVMMTRARLGELSSDWVLPTRVIVAKLKNTLERTLNEVYRTMGLKFGKEAEEEFRWILTVKVQLQDGRADTNTVSLKMTRSKDDNGQWGPWEINSWELESVLCLWVSSLSNENRKKGNTTANNYFYVGPASDEGINDHRIWIHRIITPEQVELSPKNRYFGHVEGLRQKKLPLGVAQLRPGRPDARR